MNPELEDVPVHMRKLGLGALTHAIGHCNYVSPENDVWNELSVLQAAHAAEILLKARIAEEHPLLIFDHLPKPSKSSGELMSFEDLAKKGRTVQFADLPARLWATTGMRLDDETLFRHFGELRNTLQHFTRPDGIDFSHITNEFIFGVIDPFINRCWGLYAIDYNEDYEPYIHLIASLVSRQVKFLVSSEAAEEWKNAKISWTGVTREYRDEMEKRVTSALVG